jgi:maltokinase
MPGPVLDELAALLHHWLPGQRWFAGKGRPFQLEQVVQLGTLSEEPYRSDVWLVHLRYDDGSAETYQVPLVRRPEPVDTLAHVLVGEITESAGPAWWYDALHDKEVTGSWLRLLEGNALAGGMAFHLGPGVTTLPVGAPSLVLTVEQSNTSLVFGDNAILKVFRRLTAGVNPDIEVHEALARDHDRGGERHVARLFGHVSARWQDEQGAGVDGSLAMLQEFFRTATDGWELAKISVRDLYAEADLHASEVGGDFAGEAFRLGVATAEIHADLARALPTGQLDRDQLAALAAAMMVRLERATAIVPELAEFGPALRETYEALDAHPAGVPVQRIHGDFHLGNVVRTSHRWVVLDFEGEPAKPLGERRAPDSPLRDVAGMLRSFDYAARHLLADHRTERQLAYRAEEWADRNRSAFCDGYAETGGQDPRKDTVLLRAYEADKAVYEAVYEARNRPSWLAIPLASLARLSEGVAG